MDQCSVSSAYPLPVVVVGQNDTALDAVLRLSKQQFDVTWFCEKGAPRINAPRVRVVVAETATSQEDFVKLLIGGTRDQQQPVLLPS